jgi:hypothetical protein
MKRLILTAVITVALVAVVGRVGRAQTQAPANHPDFSGKWAVDVLASSPGLVLDATRLTQPFLVTPPKTLQPSFANTFIARQDSSALAIDRRVGSDQTRPRIVIRVVCRLDGSDSLNVEGTTKTVSTVTWRNGAPTSHNDTLTILTRLADTGTVPGLNLERVMSLDADGRLLIGTKSGIDPTYLTVYRRANQ